MDQSLDQRVIALLERFTDRPAAEITPDLLLFDDLGLDGDDAVNFFEAFGAEFPADLEFLYGHWGSYFGPEGWTLSNSAQAAMGICFIGMPIVVLAAWLGLPRWLCITSSLAAYMIWLVPLRMWPFKSKEVCPISVEDLTTTARTGRWTTASKPDLS